MYRSIFALILALPYSLFGQQAWTLEQCVKRAEERNLAVLDAALEAELAGRDHDRARWDLLPDLNGVATHGYNYGRVSDRFTNTFATDQVRTNNFYLSSNLSLFEGLRKQNAIKQAATNSEAAEQGYQAALNDARLAVVQAFLDVLGLRERIEAAEQQLATTREQIGLTTAMVEAGRLARAELLTIQAQQAQEEYALTDLRNQHDQRLFALGRALQLEANELRTFDIVAPALGDAAVAPPALSTDEVLDNVLRNNPAYRQAELQVRSAERSVAIARAGMIPSLSVNGSLGTGYSGRNYRQVGDVIVGSPVLIGATQSGEAVYAPSFNYNTELVPFSEQLDQNFNQSFGFTLSVPLFNNMRNRFAISQARVRHEQARNRLAGTRNELQGNVLDALVMLRSAYSQYQAASKAVEAGNLALEYAQERFNQGAITSIELSTAKANLNRSMADLINAKYQYVMASKYLDVLQGLPVTL
jgi:outer membrane protein